MILTGNSSKDTTEIKVCEKEYDSPELNHVFKWLRNNGWSLGEQTWGVAGSQELNFIELSKGNIKAEILLETYMGATITVDKEVAHIFDGINLTHNKNGDQGLVP